MDRQFVALVVVDLQNGISPCRLWSIVRTTLRKPKLAHTYFFFDRFTEAEEGNEEQALCACAFGKNQCCICRVRVTEMYVPCRVMNSGSARKLHV